METTKKEGVIIQAWQPINSTHKGTFSGGIARDRYINRNSFVDAMNVDIHTQPSTVQGTDAITTFTRFTNDPNAPYYTFIPSVVAEDNDIFTRWILYGQTRGTKLVENSETYYFAMGMAIITSPNPNIQRFESGFTVNGIRADNAFNWSSKGEVIAFSARMLDVTAFSDEERGTPSGNFGEIGWVFRNTSDTYIKTGNSSWRSYGREDLRRNGYGIFISNNALSFHEVFFDSDGNKDPIFVLPETSENFSRGTANDLGYSSKAPAPYFVDADNKLFFGYKNIVYATELFNRLSGAVEEDQTAGEGLLSDITEDQVGSDSFNYVYLTGGILTLIKGVNNSNTGNFETEEIIKINNDTNEIISENAGLSIARGVTTRSIVRDDGLLDTQIYITNEVLRLPDEDIIEFMIVNKDRMEIFTNPVNNTVGKPKRFSWNRVSEVYEYVVEIDTDIVWCGINVDGITYFIAGSDPIIYYANGYDNVKLKKIHNRKVLFSRCNRYGIGSYNGIIYFTNAYFYEDVTYTSTQTPKLSSHKIYSFGKLQENDQITLSVENSLDRVHNPSHPAYMFINSTLLGNAENPLNLGGIKRNDTLFLAFEDIRLGSPSGTHIESSSTIDIGSAVHFKSIERGETKPSQVSDFTIEMHPIQVERIGSTITVKEIAIEAKLLPGAVIIIDFRDGMYQQSLTEPDNPIFFLPSEKSVFRKKINTSFVARSPQIIPVVSFLHTSILSKPRNPVLYGISFEYEELETSL